MRCLKKLRKQADTHYNWNWSSTSVMHCILGRVINLDTMSSRHNYGAGLFFKMCHNITNKCEPFTSFKCMQLGIVKLLSFLCEIMYRWRNHAWILFSVPILLNVVIISNAVARWRAMHVSRVQNVVSFTKYKIIVYFMKVAWCSWQS